VGPAAVAMIAPIGAGLARRHHLNPVPIGLMVVNGASAGSFSPIGIFGLITNNVVERTGLAGSPLTLFAANLLFNIVLGVIIVVLFGRQERARRLAATELPTDSVVPAVTLNGPRALTVAGLTALTIGALFFNLDVGFSAFVVAVVLSACDPKGAKGATDQIAWSTTLLVCGIVTYVSLMQALGTVNYLGNHVAAVGTALTGALLICYIGGVVSAFASTTGILGTLIPLAVPFLERQQVSAIGLITALAISASVVDSSPFSTSGSLVVANAPDDQRDLVFRGLLRWGFSMVALAPPVAWLILVVPGWL
jgi:di/tricarboxylate transporter